MAIAKTTAGALLTLLEIKHRDDVGVVECKTGPSQSGPGCLRFDYWVMPRSWTKPWVSGYEIKVSRGDFVNDDKWPGYLPYCNQFSFVTPWGLVQPEELPQDVGLFWASKNVERLYCKRKPALRTNVQIPDDIFRYVLMGRVRVVSSQTHNRITGEDVKQYLDRGSTQHSFIDERFKSAVRKQVEKQVGEIRSRNKDLENENRVVKSESERYAHIKQALEDLGLSLSKNHWMSIEDQIREKFSPKRVTLDSLKRVHESIGEFLGGNGG